MLEDLNPTQAKGLANFFYDLAKGLLLGGVGLSYKTPFSLRLIVLSTNILFAFLLVKAALSVTRDMK